MRRFLSVFKMDLLNLIKNPVLVGYNTLFSALIILIMGYLTGGGYADVKNAYQYYTVSLLVYGMLNGAMTASNCFMERDIKRPNLRIIHSPAGSFPIYFSKIATSFIFDYFFHLVTLAVLCPILNVTLGVRPIYFIMLMAPVEFAAAALGTFFCCIFHNEETTSTVLSLFVSIFCFMGGTFFSLDGMGRSMALISKISPVKWLNDAFFTISCDNSLSLFWPVFAGAVIISALLVLGCRLTFRTEDYI